MTKQDLVEKDKNFKELVQISEHMKEMTRAQDCGAPIGFSCGWSQDGGWLVHTVHQTEAAMVSLLSTTYLPAETPEYCHEASYVSLTCIKGSIVVVADGKETLLRQGVEAMTLKPKTRYSVRAGETARFVAIVMPKDSAFISGEYLVEGEGAYQD